MSLVSSTHARAGLSAAAVVLLLVLGLPFAGSADAGADGDQYAFDAGRADWLAGDDGFTATEPDVATPDVAAAPEEPEGEGIFFPVQLPVNFSDTWGAPRGGGRSHEGVDILGEQMLEVYAAEGGEIMRAYGEDCADGAYCGSYALAIAGDDGRGYFYVHMNNDTPGRPNGCDGHGGVENAFSPRLVEELDARGTLEGVRVERAEHIGYNGSSGNAGCGVDHIHFDIWMDHDYWRSGWKINPYSATQAAYDAGEYFTEPQVEATPSVGRVAGPDRYSTGAALSAAAFESADTVVLARGDEYTDALVAAPLAAASNAPVLLVPPEGRATSAVIAEINRLGPTSATVVGNLEGSVITSIVQETDLSLTSISRITGGNRYALSAAVAREVVAAGGSTDRVLVAAGGAPEGRSAWPDALMASLLGSHELSPVLLTDPDSLSPETADVLAEFTPSEVSVVGGTAAVSSAVSDQITGGGASVARLAGPSRLETAVAVMGEVDADLSTFYIATASNFPDALAAGPALARMDAGMLLMGTSNGSGPVLEWIGDNAGLIDEVMAIGGTAALSDRSANAAVGAAE
ncbi:cell wall-binding repeat-containing protein [Euzebya tangerina]|uniref:cell wall-binding repeat-containing protein n=1 Tax=Euzebya tangerina TaxID=591198 RepID=UPI002F32F7BC